MNNFSFDELQKKDLLTALGLWLVVEVVSFILFPTVGLISPGARLRTWFLLSIPFGLGGAALISMSSRFVATAGDRPQRRLSSLIGQFGGWAGLAGILFPFVVVCVEFFSNLNLR